MSTGKRELTDTEWYSKNSRKLMSTSKKVIWLLTINGIMWIWCTYLLAWFDKVQIAETLSSSICTVVLGQTLGYLITSCVSAIFRYNPKFGGESTYPDDLAAKASTETNTNNTTV